MQIEINYKLLFAACMILLGGPLLAQHGPLQASDLVVQVKSLSSAERDALRQDLATSSNIELAYACVPAGILVFEAKAVMTQADLRSQVFNMVTGRTSSSRAKEISLDRAQVEERCAAVRGQ